MQAFSLSTLLDERERSGRPWLEFLRVSSLSLGLYHLKAGEVDQQQPHTEDEVYYVVSGRCRFQADEKETTVEPGTVLFVEKSVEHRFCEIAEDLTALVFFAPSEGSLKA